MKDLQNEKKDTLKRHEDAKNRKKVAEDNLNSLPKYGSILYRVGVWIFKVLVFLEEADRPRNTVYVNTRSTTYVNVGGN